MSLFGRKKEEKKGLRYGGNCNTELVMDVSKTKPETITDKIVVKILGSGCKKCNELEENTKEAIKKLGIDAIIDHVTDFTQIASFGVMTTPALVVNEKVIAYGKVLKTEEVIKLLQKVI